MPTTDSPETLQERNKNENVPCQPSGILLQLQKDRSADMWDYVDKP